MATRVHMADVSGFVTSALQEVRAGLEGAKAVGIDIEMPEAMTFNFEIVSDAQSMIQVTETLSEEVRQAAVDGTTRTSAANEVTTEAAVTDTETTQRDATTDTTEGGSDIETTNNTWDEFIDS